MLSSVNQSLPNAAELPCSDDIPDLSAAEQERQRAEKLEAYLRSQGIDPDNLPG